MPKIGWATESIVIIKMIESGVAKEKITLLFLPLIAINILWSFLISKFTTGKRPLFFGLNTIFVKYI